MKKYMIFVLVFAIIFFAAVTTARAIDVGAQTLPFYIATGDNKPLTFDDVKGKVLVIFYETKGVIEKNRPLKNELKKFFAAQSDAFRTNIVTLPIIKCPGGGLFISMWKKALRENSAKEGLAIYGDWGGKMYSDYNFADNESNFVIIDKNGVVQYITAGVVPDADTSKIEDLLKKLAE